MSNCNSIKMIWQDRCVLTVTWTERVLAFNLRAISTFRAETVQSTWMNKIKVVDVVRLSGYLIYFCLNIAGCSLARHGDGIFMVSAPLTAFLITLVIRTEKEHHSRTISPFTASKK